RPRLPHPPRAPGVGAVIQPDTPPPRAGRLHHLRRLVPRDGGEGDVVVAPFVGQPGDRQTARVFHFGIERDRVRFTRQPFGVRPPRGGVGVIVQELLQLGAVHR